MTSRPLVSRLLLSAGFSCCGALLSLSTAAAPAPQPTPTPLGPKVGQLIQQLGDADARKRDDAVKQLEAVGDPARAALVHAARHATLPEVRARATRLLVTMSWASPLDPSPIKQALQDYRTTDPQARIQAADRLITLSGAGSFDALVRLMLEEPVEDVRWALCRMLRQHADDAQRRQLRDLDLARIDDAPLLVAIGWAWNDTDPAKAADVFRRAAQLATKHPANDQNELDLILGTLYVQALNTGRYDDAAEAARQSAWRSESAMAESLMALFVLHAQYGPLKGFDRDIAAFADEVDQPQLLYALGRMNARLGRPLVATAYYQAAAAYALADPNAHQRTAEFLSTRGWHDLARAEYQLALAAPGDDKESRDAQAYVGLARCDAADGREADAARNLEKALDIAMRQQGAVRSEKEFRAEIEWHYLRDAKERKDVDDAARRVDRIARFGIANAEMAIDVVTTLKAAGRTQEAKNVFQTFYNEARQELEHRPKDPEALNNIAWLCARCGEQLDDARRWSAEAVQLAPANYAYLDTAGEAAADVGHYADAVKYESMALKLQPGDRFMSQQLERFKKGLADSQK